MYCVFNSTLSYDADTGNPFGWPLEQEYGYFCDERDKGLFMLSHGPLNVIALVGAYLLIVLYIGPKFMKNRKPYEIKSLMRFHNAAMILVNIYLIKGALVLVDYGRSFFNCKAVEMDLNQVDTIALLTEAFLLSRLAEFLDTIWFVLRKKQSHISFLHVFHHSYVPIVAYVATRITSVVPIATSFPFINSIVHVIMYSYYLMATFPALRPYLWWKRYLTGLQMLQFISVLVYNIFGYFYLSNVCEKSHATPLIGSLVSAVIFLVLFNSFYKLTYKQPAARETAITEPGQKTKSNSSSTITPAYSRKTE